MAPLADFANGTFSIPVYELAISGATQVKRLVLACAYCDQATPRLTRADLEAELQQRDKRGILAIRYVYAHLSYHSHENTNKNIRKDLLFPMTPAVSQKGFESMQDGDDLYIYIHIHTHTHAHIYVHILYIVVSKVFYTSTPIVHICTHYGQKSLSLKSNLHMD